MPAGAAVEPVAHLIDAARAASRESVVTGDAAFGAVASCVAIFRHGAGHAAITAMSRRSIGVYAGAAAVGAALLTTAGAGARGANLPSAALGVTGAAAGGVARNVHAGAAALLERIRALDPTHTCLTDRSAADLRTHVAASAAILRIALERLASRAAGRVSVIASEGAPANCARWLAVGRGRARCVAASAIGCVRAEHGATGAAQRFFTTTRAHALVRARLAHVTRGAATIGVALLTVQVRGKPALAREREARCERNQQPATQPGGCH